MDRKNKAQQDNILKRLDKVCEQGIKLTKKNLDEVAPSLYELAEDAFNGWMGAKKALYAYQSANRAKRRKEMLVSEQLNLQIENISKEKESSNENNNNDISDILMNKLENLFGDTKSELSEEDIAEIKSKDEFLFILLQRSYGDDNSIISKYNEYYQSKHGSKGDNILISLIDILSRDNIVAENVFSKRHQNVYNDIVAKYGSVRSSIVTYLKELNEIRESQK